MTWQPIHEREYYDIPGVHVELFNDEYLSDPFVVVQYEPGFVFGNISPFAEGKLQACKKLGKHYDRMRVVDMVFDPGTERVTELVFAYRKAGA